MKRAVLLAAVVLALGASGAASAKAPAGFLPYPPVKEKAIETLGALCAESECFETRAPCWRRSPVRVACELWSLEREELYGSLRTIECKQRFAMYLSVRYEAIFVDLKFPRCETLSAVYLEP